jgi:hypothetical protein
MKKTLGLIIFILLGTIAFSQEDYQDVVYLKNGSIIRGIIIEQIPNISIKIETASRGVIVYQIDEIERITKEPVIETSQKSKNGNGLEKGYQLIVESSLLVARGDGAALEATVSNGYRFNQYVYVGVGTGLIYFPGYNEAAIPLFVDLRVNFTNTKVSPYFGLGAGIAYTGDLFNYFIPDLGITFKISKKIVMNVGIGYINLHVGISF